jgi:AcrR family transcriptional regulator
MDDAIAKAQALFWRDGFAGISLTTLASAVGVHKPSLYAAYGDKRDLYIAAFDAYQKVASKLVAAALGEERLRDALTAFFTADLDLFLAGSGRGCFMLATTVPLALGDDDMAARVRQSLDGLRAALARRVERASEDGHLSKALDPATATDIIMSTHIALANRARVGTNRAELEMTAYRVVYLVCRT